MNKAIKGIKPLTEEEKQQQAARVWMQKRESIATGVLFNLMHNTYLSEASEKTDQIATFAIEIADKMIEKLYFQNGENEEEIKKEE